MAVLGVLLKDGVALDPMPTGYFRLRREFDRSGSINLGEDAIRLPEDDAPFVLEPDSEYEVSFLLGRYPGPLWKVRHSDRIFAPMTRLAEGKAASAEAGAAATAAARADRPCPELPARDAPGSPGGGGHVMRYV